MKTKTTKAKNILRVAAGLFMYSLICIGIIILVSSITTFLVAVIIHTVVKFEEFAKFISVPSIVIGSIVGIIATAIFIYRDVKGYNGVKKK